MAKSGILLLFILYHHLIALYSVYLIFMYEKDVFTIYLIIL